MFGFGSPFYHNQSSPVSLQDYLAPPRRQAYPPGYHPSKCAYKQPPQYYNQYAPEYYEDEEDEYDEYARYNPYRRQELLRQQQELQRRQQEQLRQQEIERQRELLRQRQALRKQQLYRQQQQQQQRIQERAKKPVAIDYNKHALRIQKVFRGYLVRKQNLLPKLRAIQRVESEVNLIISRSTAILTLPTDGSVTLGADTQYVGGIPKQFLALELELTSKLIDLDGMSSGPSEIVRGMRKALVIKIETTLSGVDVLKKVYAFVPPTETSAPATELESPEESIALLFAGAESDSGLASDTNSLTQTLEAPEEYLPALFAEAHPESSPADTVAESPEEYLPTLFDAPDAPASDQQSPEEYLQYLFDEPPAPSAPSTPSTAASHATTTTSPYTTPDVPYTPATPTLASTPTSTGLMGDWVCMEDPTPTSILPEVTTPVVFSTIDTSATIAAAARQIPTLRNMCYSVCNQLIQRTLVAQG